MALTMPTSALDPRGLGKQGKGSRDSGGNPDDRSYAHHIGEPEGKGRQHGPKSWTHGQLQDAVEAIKRGKLGYFSKDETEKLEEIIESAAGSDGALSRVEAGKLLPHELDAHRIGMGISGPEANKIKRYFSGNSDE